MEDPLRDDPQEGTCPGPSDQPFPSFTTSLLTEPIHLNQGFLPVPPGDGPQKAMGEKGETKKPP
jgi:hypothetical protein